MSIGDKIKSIRQNKGISREDLADKLGVSKFAVAKYEQGQRQPNIEIANKIASALGVVIGELIESNNNEIDLSNIPTKYLVNELNKRYGGM